MNEQKYMTEDNDIIVGIDLGTTNSCVAIWRNKKLEIITDKHGNRAIPSVVSFNDGVRYIGHEAKNQIDINSKNTFYNIKRYIGKTYDDEVVQYDLKRTSYKHHIDQNKIFLKLENDDKLFPPEEISAMVLSKLKQMASNYLSQPVKKAVITIPAYFNDAQRQATKDAAKIAGLQVVRLLNEPTAAALAYGLYSKDDKNIIIFDLGGGTLDVSLLNIDDGIFQVLAISGNSHMGGEDFDQRIINYCINKFKKKNKLGYLKELTQNSVHKLKKECERAKRMLSTNEQANICVENFYCGLKLYICLTRKKFDELCNDLFIMCLKYVEQVLCDAKLGVVDVDEIVLVGGSTRMVRMQELLSIMFNNKKLNKSVNPDEVVAAGAALQAYRMTYPDDPFSENIVLLDVTPLTLGVETLKKIMTPIIPRNTCVPVTRKRHFTTDSDFETSVLVRVFEGERKLTKDNFLVGSFELKGFESLPRGGVDITITYSIDVNGIITVKASEKKSGKLKEIQICGNKGRLTDEQIDELIIEAKAYELADNMRKDKEQLLYKISDICNNVLDNIKSDSIRLKECDKADVLSDIQNVLDKLKKDKQQNDDLEKELARLKKNYGPLILKMSKDELNVKNVKDGKAGTAIYGDDSDSDDNRYDYDEEYNEEKDELKQIKQSLEELCVSLLNILDTANINEKDQFRDYIEKVLLWMHVKENCTIIDYKRKIDEINEYTQNVMTNCDKNIFIEENENIEKKELEELCYMIKYNIVANSFSLQDSDMKKLEQCIDETLDNIESDNVFDFKSKMDEINNLCEQMCSNMVNNDDMEIDNMEIDNCMMGTHIVRQNNIDEGIGELLMDIDMIDDQSDDDVIMIDEKNNNIVIIGDDDIDDINDIIFLCK